MQDMEEQMSKVREYAKFVMALLGAVATVVTTQFPSTTHWVTIAVGFVSSVLVLLVPNVKSTKVE